MSHHATHPSELQWTRHLADDLGRIDAWRLRRHLEACPACRERAAALAAEREAFDASPRRLDEVARLRAHAAVARSSWEAGVTARTGGGWRWTGALAAGAMAAALVVTGVHLGSRGPPALREKGGDVLALYVDRPGGARALPDRCAPGDRIMARYRTGHPYLLLLERDGRGVLQVLFPRDGAASGRLPAAEGATPSAWVLDDAPGQECFLGVFSDEPVALERARGALDRQPAGLPGAVVRVQCCTKGAPR